LRRSFSAAPGHRGKNLYGSGECKFAGFTGL
jgi:hypothetical protein